MELETDAGGLVADPTEDDIHEVFADGAVIGGFVRLARAPDDYLYVELDPTDDDQPADWDGGVVGVYRCEPGTGRLELEEWSPDGYGDGPRDELADMFVYFSRGVVALAEWERRWRGQWRGDC